MKYSKAPRKQKVGMYSDYSGTYIKTLIMVMYNV